MARVVVEVMPKPEILDPQGKAVTGALARMGFAGLTVRQGKRFEIEVEGELDEARLAQVHEAAEKLLANTVIEAFEVRSDEASTAPVGGSPADPASVAQGQVSTQPDVPTSEPAATDAAAVPADNQPATEAPNAEAAGQS
ncbi:phosphoribosylformylglycinamidine synthase subunit PurS [Desertihabitans brevis]|uniref:Phosphoribosylformylglycinamidine synthase subunit PurS n=1 Tax=Desertihabitans brevis TaxID=2268447 RepID=A0A367YUK7_9ACTN|nr:phosphoribosylformylglycinamidine synthase subunit PurS [Desertihabitans brevis]